MGIYDSIYQYGGGYGNVGATATPMLTGNGASNPVGSFLQGAASPGASGISSFGGSGGMSDIQFDVSKPTGVGATGNLGVGGSGLGWNMDTGKMVLGGIQTIGNLWQAWEANKLAKAQFAFQKEFAQKNMANQIASYNTTLEDRGRTRAFTESQTPEQAAQYIEQNKLPA